MINQKLTNFSRNIDGDKYKQRSNEFCHGRGVILRVYSGLTCT